MYHVDYLQIIYQLLIHSNYLHNKTILHQLITFQKMRKLEGENKNEEVKRLSLKYNVLSKYTAFISIDKTTRTEIKNIQKGEMFNEEFARHYDSIHHRGSNNYHNSNFDDDELQIYAYAGYHRRVSSSKRFYGFGLPNEIVVNDETINKLIKS